MPQLQEPDHAPAAGKQREDATSIARALLFSAARHRRQRAAGAAAEPTRP